MAVLVKEPRLSSSEIAGRIIDTEASLGEKLMLIECWTAAANELANHDRKKARNPASDGIHGQFLPMLERMKLQQKKDDLFFGVSSLFDQPMQKVGTVTRTSKSLSSKDKSKPHKNNFYPVCDLFISQLLCLLSEQVVLS